MSTRPCVVLLSGGLDSAVTAAVARRLMFKVHALSFDYGQRHVAELEAARELAVLFGAIEHKVIPIDLRVFGGSALTADIDVPKDRTDDGGIPITYVPARNTIFLSYALAWAEVLGSSDIFIGVNALDYSGYPDCRPEFIVAYQAMARLATKAGVLGAEMTIHSPLISLSKAQIIEMGSVLGVDFAKTVSCYDADDKGQACGHCDSCTIRARGFAEAGYADPTRYA